MSVGISESPTAAGDSRYLEVVAASKRFRALTVIDQLDLRVSKGELISLLGPSGCGKTTLLRMIAGLVKADAGDIVVGGRDITNNFHANVAAFAPRRISSTA